LSCFFVQVAHSGTCLVWIRWGKISKWTVVRIINGVRLIRESITMTQSYTIGTVYLRAADPDRLSAFYQERIGLRQRRIEDGILYLGTASRDLLGLIAMPEGKRYRGGTGLYHFALLVPTRFDLALMLKHFAESRTPLQGMSDHLVSEAIYLEDPEGNGIEVYADRPRSAWYRDGQFQLDSVALNLDSLFGELQGRDAAWNGIPDQTVMGHIHLHVGSVRQAEQFYNRLLAMDTMMNMGSASFLSYEGYHHHLGINTWAGSASVPDDALGLDHWELRVGDPALFAGLQPHATAGASGELILQDPFRNRVHIFAPSEATD
jgi:catechol 2,3-dioxygenase